MTFPVAHGVGNYFADPGTLQRIEGNGQVVFRYYDDDGESIESANFNGSVNSIAGICNEQRNVVGLMPHPERASDPLLGPTDGLKMLSGIRTFLSVLAQEV